MVTVSVVALLAAVVPASPSGAHNAPRRCGSAQGFDSGWYRGQRSWRSELSQDPQGGPPLGEKVHRQQQLSPARLVQDPCPAGVALPGQEHLHRAEEGALHRSERQLDRALLLGGLDAGVMVAAPPGSADTQQLQ